MSKKNKQSNMTPLKIFYFFLFSFLVIFPVRIFAVAVTASSTSAVSAGDTSIIDVFINTEGKVINSVDGSIVLSDEHQGNFEIKDISLVNSAFTMWPRKPSLEADRKISFVGGVPGGVQGDRVLLFRVVVKINQSGNFTIKPDGVRAYVNDGLGTAVNATNTGSIIAISLSSQGEVKNLWEEIISNDNTAPAPFEISMVSDPNIYDGKKFITFETTDMESGISHYEVREGAYEAVRAGTNYVLITQDEDVEIVVTAYDKAGNFQVAVLNEKTPVNWTGILVALAIIISIYQIIKLVRSKKKKVNEE